MKKTLSVILAVLMALACVCVLASCGGNTEETTAATEDTTAAAEETTVDPANSLVVGYTIYEPMNYLDENQELVGFDTELAKAVFEKLGYAVIFQEIEWSSKYTDLDSGTIDCIWNGFTANTADDDGVLRAEKVDFSYNYMENQQVVVVKADAGIAAAEDLSGKFGAAESGSAGETYAQSFEGTTVKGFIKQTECLTEVMSGTADFAVVDAQLAKAYVGEGDYADLAVVEDLSSDVEFYAIGFKKGSDLTAKVNEQLEALAADGTIAALAEKYGVSNTVITDFADQK